MSIWPKRFQKKTKWNENVSVCSFFQSLFIFVLFCSFFKDCSFSEFVHFSNFVHFFKVCSFLFIFKVCSFLFIFSKFVHFGSFFQSLFVFVHFFKVCSLFFNLLFDLNPFRPNWYDWIINFFETVIYRLIIFFFWIFDVLLDAVLQRGADAGHSAVRHHRTMGAGGLQRQRPHRRPCPHPGQQLHHRVPGRQPQLLYHDPTAQSITSHFFHINYYYYCYY